MNLYLRAVLFAAALPVIVSAQSTLGTITGLVTDKSGPVIPSAVVVGTNTATGVRAETVTSGTGNYVIPNLQVGPYEVSVSVSGFKSFSRSGINLSSEDNIRVTSARRCYALVPHVPDECGNHQGFSNLRTCQE